MEKPNIIWFMIDSLRNEFLNEFGAEAERNFLDDLISEGVSFTNCHSVAPFTVVSMGAKLTGCLPSVTGLDGWMKKDPIKAVDFNCVNIIDILRYNGYYNTLYCDAPYGIYLPGDSFDEYVAQNGYENYPIDNYIKQKGSKFIYLCTDIIHDSCCKCGHFTKEDYKKAVKKTADILKGYYEKIKTDNDLILITSDHGVRCVDDFKGDKYKAEGVTGRYLTEKTTHCSFNIIWKGHLHPMKIKQLCRSVDILPTLFDILGYDYPKLDGLSLKPTLEGGKVNIKYTYTITGWSITHPKTIGALCVKDGRYKLVEFEEKRGFCGKWISALYDYISDPEEIVDVSGKYPDKVKELQKERDRMIFTRRNVLDLYQKCGYDYKEVLSVRSKDSKSIQFVNGIINNVYIKITRKKFLHAYRKSEIKRLIYYYFFHKMLYKY